MALLWKLLIFMTYVASHKTPIFFKIVFFGGGGWLTLILTKIICHQTYNFQIYFQTSVKKVQNLKNMIYVPILATFCD